MATNLITLSDSVMFLTDTNLVQLTQNDNAGRGTRASMLEWTCPSDGRYYLKIRSYNPVLMGQFQVRVSTSPLVVPGTIPCTSGNDIERSLTTCAGYNGDQCRCDCTHARPTRLCQRG